MGTCFKMHSWYLFLVSGFFLCEPAGIFFFFFFFLYLILNWSLMINCFVQCVIWMFGVVLSIVICESIVQKTKSYLKIHLYIRNYIHNFDIYISEKLGGLTTNCYGTAKPKLHWVAARSSFNTLIREFVENELYQRCVF